MELSGATTRRPDRNTDRLELESRPSERGSCDSLKTLKWLTKWEQERDLKRPRVSSAKIQSKIQHHPDPGAIYFENDVQNAGSIP